MKGFNFKLESVLKLRKFHEKKVMNELADIVKEIESTKERIRGIHSAIDEGYQSQKVAVTGHAKGHELSFYPYFFKGKKEDLKNQENLLHALDKKYQRKVAELARAQGDAKIIQNLKEKKIDEFKKEVNKKIEDQREELVIMRRAMKEGQR
ncbi:MAG: hypothetical protein ACPGJV_12850 [Bacteriovoracaceae bacterium]